MGPEPLFEPAIAVSNSWLHKCLNNHNSCAKKARHAHIFCTDNQHIINDLKGDGLVPSRLLAFAKIVPSTGEPDMVKLVLSTELGEHTQYVALSHRWGSPGSSPPRTLESNIKCHVEDGLRYEDLPQTFRDTIDVTRALGYEFLWIDSLCIIQDSAEDWKKEARRMAIIYDNSVLTIAAMDAEDSSQGLSPKRGGCLSTLESRAWVCQERMIAPRTLMFTKGSVAWECRQATASLDSPAFAEGHGGTVVDCDHEGWVPPTRPKAIFAFFRDWRLPPLRKESDGYESESTDSGQDINVEDATTGTSALQMQISPAVEQNLDVQAQPAEKTNSEGQLAEFVSPATAVEGTLPDFTWSDDDPPIKIWNVAPPEGESGVYYDQKSNEIYMCYGDDLAAHAANLLSQKDLPACFITLFDKSSEDGKDLFGSFRVDVQKLLRPESAYEPFMRVWWNFLALYTPRNLTYDSDAFLAMNGITSISQRWTHTRNSFGLWFNFLQFDLCWYVDPDVQAVRPMTPKWIVPSWSWASTRGGLVRNAFWQQNLRRGSLMIKPEIVSASGTAFDMPLPFPAWRNSRYHNLELKGNLRASKLRRVQTAEGKTLFELDIEPTGRFSDHEVHTFHPDCPLEIPLGEEIGVWTFHMWHFAADEDANSNGHCLDIHLVLISLGNDDWVSHYGPSTMEMERLEDERTMRRLGLVETTYHEDQQRDAGDIHEDMWWKFVRLV
ncbi:hypothetical protein HBI23_046730 [Parastagonospora nodorum]|nr:hypothetical protein HBI12_031960 [Parastagonospora nodorum]KAH5454384.1 hypothetical protein HBI47_014720 [Parastagonospora nodorum]KAH5685878.1 hypothetical protein HBI23_046730 [Parastagonospora nodorum]